MQSSLSGTVTPAAAFTKWAMLEPSYSCTQGEESLSRDVTLCTLHDGMKQLDIPRKLSSSWGVLGYWVESSMESR